MTKEEIIKELSFYREKQAKLSLKRLERKKLCIKKKKIKRELNINITPKYTEGGKSINKVSSVVENTVVQRDEILKEIDEKIEALNEDIQILDIEIKQLDVRLGSLTFLEKEIITAYYVDGMSMEEIGLHTYYKVKHQTRERRTIKKMIKKIETKMAKI